MPQSLPLVLPVDPSRTPGEQQYQQQIQRIAASATSYGTTAQIPTNNLYTGQIYFNTTLQEQQVYNGVDWISSAASNAPLSNTQLQQVSAIVAENQQSTYTAVPTGSTLPGYGTVGQFFYNTTSNLLYQWNGYEWLSVGVPSGSGLPISGTTGQFFANTNNGLLYTWTGTTWNQVGVAYGSTLPLTGVAGQFFANSTDGQLYVYNGSAWVAAVPAANITGQITTTQITNGAITTPLLAANSVTAGNIVANTIVAGNIAAGTITATQIAASTITAAEIAAGTITATQIAASTITGGNIAATTISGNKMIAGTVTATQMAANTITAASGIIANAAVQTLTIAGNAVTVPVGVYTAAAISPYSSGATCQTAFIATTIIAPIILTISCHYGNQYYSSGLSFTVVPSTLYITRNGTTIFSCADIGYDQNATAAGSAAEAISFTIVDNPGIGSWTYLYYFTYGTPNNNAAFCSNNSITLLCCQR